MWRCFPKGLVRGGLQKGRTAVEWIKLQNPIRGYCCILLGGLYHKRMGHKCKSPNCKRRTGERCDTCRVGSGVRVFLLDANGKPVKPAGKRPHATPHEKEAAVDMYFDGLSYRRVARNMEQYFGRKTDPKTVCRWVRELTGTADDVLRPVKVDTGREGVSDESMVNVSGEKMWRFNVMDSDARFVLAAYLTPERTARATQTTLAMAR